MPLFVFEPFEVSDTYLYLQIFLMLSKWTSTTVHIPTPSYMVSWELKWPHSMLVEFAYSSES